MEIRSTRRTGTGIAAALCMLAVLSAPGVPLAKELPHEFTAHYALEMFGTVLARAKYTLEHTENGLSMTQSTRPAGLASLLRDDKLDVRSDMIVDNGQILLVSYDYIHTGDDKDRDVRFRIKWQADGGQQPVGTASGVYEGKPVHITVENPVWDPLSIQVPIMLDANKNLPPHKHGLFMKGEFKNYLFENHGEQTISLNDQEYTAVKIGGRETERDRAMYVWLIPELHYVPAIIEQWKEGKLKSTVYLESVSFNDEGETRTLSLSDSPEDYE